MPKRPIDRTAPTDGWRAARSASRSAISVPVRAARVDEVVLLVHRERRQRRRAGEGMAAIGEPARKWLVLERVGDRLADADRAELYVGARESLRHRDHVGHDAPVLDRKPLAGPAEPAHDLVGDHQDAVLVAERAHALHVAVGRNEDAVGAGHRLEDERGDRVRTFELDHLFEIAQSALGRCPTRARSRDTGRARGRSPASAA